MKESTKRRLRRVLFTAGGVLAGLGYYSWMGCTTGSCPITSTPISAMLYMGVVGWLLSGVFEKECDSGCGI